MGRSDEILRLLVFKINIFKDWLFFISGFLESITQLFRSRHFVVSWRGAGSDPLK